MTRARWTRRARADLSRIDDFNVRNDPAFADAVGRAAIAAGDFLAEFPHAGSMLDDGERKWRVPHTDYILVYRVTNGDVEILRAYHGREDWRRRRL
ncbi:type II toxin-antitoxin system RelE/ParE family toxin [Sphingomonas sp. RP10(2022)]|uniref:Type II toxin-antitoxin system RelE/ParE family toxin n=1 Tax=Sphingomonas liriopis TaxID=2949094 RepID=A0A9X2KQA5_9SPHN|nr:type II toxin-antitoxin system RelE/ParE family toxin [Sphingomonas liriopis]MCP3735534.1 type II toxin-antitoxin system RelE/ParE family toxin [Sphingomonas liriopis]